MALQNGEVYWEKVNIASKDLCQSVEAGEVKLASQEVDWRGRTASLLQRQRLQKTLEGLSWRGSEEKEEGGWAWGDSQGQETWKEVQEVSSIYTYLYHYLHIKNMTYNYIILTFFI